MCCRRTGNVQEYYLTERDVLKADRDVEPYYPSEKKENNSVLSESDAKDIIKRKKKKIKKNFSQKKVCSEYILEKNIEKDFIANLKVKKNSQCENIRDKIEPKDLFTTVHQFAKFNMNSNMFNFEIRNKIPVEKLLTDFGIGKEDCKMIGPCICSECSGVSVNGKKVYKVTENLESLKEHCRGYHERYLNVGDMIKFRVPDNCVIIKKESKGVEYFMMNKKDVPDKNKSDEDEIGFKEEDEMKDSFKVVGWNSASLCKPTNKVMINAFLERDKPDIVMINECGKIYEKKIIINRNYKICGKSDKVCIIYNNKYNVYQIMENLADEHNLIARVELSKEPQDKRAFILFCVYLPPNQEHRILVGDFSCKLNKVYER